MMQFNINIFVKIYTKIIYTHKTPSFMENNDSNYCDFNKILETKKILKIKEKYLIKEIEMLKNELSRAREEINRVKSVPFFIG